MATLASSNGEPKPNAELVAISGMGCRWPGGVDSPRQMWSFLRSQGSGFRPFDSASTPRCFSAAGFHHPNPGRPGTTATQGAFLIDGDPRLFDNAFFGITGRETETLDPSQRKLLEVVYEAFENAGETWTSVAGSNTGVFVGNFALDHWVIQTRDWDYPKPYSTTGASASVLANRISHIFDLRGPSVAVDTACSSSMYAVHLAVSAIRNGDCDSAIVAASNWIADPSLHIALDKLGALSPTSRCHTFDASADGYARGEGFAALYLRRLPVAVTSESPIRAVIRGTAVNANGRTGGITRPSTAGQEAVIRKAYDNAGLPFSNTTYIECHGTGTQAGDPIELAAVSQVFSSDKSLGADSLGPLFVGSVKTNMGHAEGASALAAIMKIVLSLEAGEIPPNVGVKVLNPNIDFTKARIEVAKEVIAWPEHRLRRASINSFGFGGANGHCIIDHASVLSLERVRSSLRVSLNSKLNGHTLKGYPNNGHGYEAVNNHQGLNGNGEHNLEEQIHRHHPIIKAPSMASTTNATTRQLVLLPFSAHNKSSLQLNIDALSLDIYQHQLADVAYTLSAKRSNLPHRAFRVVNRDNPVPGLLSVESKPGIQASSTHQQDQRPANVAFVFTGQGAQWHEMGLQLFEYRVFRIAIEHLDYILKSLPTPLSAWSITAVIKGNCDPGIIQTPAVSQTVCTAVQIGLVDLLASWSIRPVAVAGHSSGEIAAAYASGHSTAADAIVSAYLRGQAIVNDKQEGAMIAVGLGPDQLRDSGYLHDEDPRNGRMQIAAVNSPGSVTVSGDAPAIEALAARLSVDGVFNRLLRTGGIAYHSHHMVALGQGYEEMLLRGFQHIRQSGLVDEQKRYPHVPWMSSVIPDKDPPSSIADSAAYWRANLESPVCFSDAVSNLIRLDAAPGHDPIKVLVEIGPHSALKGPLEQILKSTGQTQIAYAGSTLKRGEDARKSILQLVGTLYCLNARANLVAVNAVDNDDGHLYRESNDKCALIHGCTAVDLPPYKYTYGPINYYECRSSKEYRLRKVPRHDLLGSKVPGVAKLRPQWRNVLRMKDLPWLGDHRLLPDAVFPAAGYIAMAIEAALRAYEEYPQPHPKPTGYTLRNVSINTALRIPEDDHGIEVILSMELDAASTASTSWARFSISSAGQADVNSIDSTWTEHCTGMVKIEVGTLYDNAEKIDTSSMDARLIDARSWYRTFTAIGLGYGPTFRAITNIRADPDKKLASATFIFPDYIKDGIKDGDPGTAEVVALGEFRGLRGAYINQLQMLGQNGDVVLDIEKLRCISYIGETQISDQTKSGIQPAFSAPFARMVWKPDFRSLNYQSCRTLFPPPRENIDRLASIEKLNMMASVILVDVYETFAKGNDETKPSPTPSGNTGHFFGWIKRCVEGAEISEITKAKQLYPLERHEIINQLYRETKETPETQIAKRLHENMADVLFERHTGIDIIVHGSDNINLLTELYQRGIFMTSAYPQLSRILDSLAHANPHMRILELGAGTGGATRVAMKALTGPNSIKRYREYVFTDISPGFLAAAQTSMAEFHDINYSVLDIEADPAAQGYLPVYDVVLASQTLHATTSISETLKNCRKLLKPGGKLLLVETTTTDSVIIGLLLGTLTGYWHGIPDGRVNGPFVNLETWDNVLKGVGFSGTELVLDDYPPPNNVTTTLVSTLMKSDSAHQNNKKTNGVLAGVEVQLLHSLEHNPPLLNRLQHVLEQRGISPQTTSLDQASETVSQDAYVVVFLDGEKDFLLDSEGHHLATFQHLARNAATLICLTFCGFSRGRNPEGALIPGLLRTIGTENPANRFISIDISVEDSDLATYDSKDLTRCVVDQLFPPPSESKDGEENESLRMNDCEYVWQDGCLWISRAVPDDTLRPYAETSPNESRAQHNETLSLQPLDSQGPIRAAFSKPGLLSSLYFRPYKELLSPIPSNYIDVKVAAVGLNWKDLAVSSGRFDAGNLSSEYAGVVTAVGTDAAGSFSVGDRVYGMGRGHFGNYTRVPAAFAQKLSAQDNLVEVATMPLVYIRQLSTLLTMLLAYGKDTMSLSSLPLAD
ncbi:Polyketide synthase-nonribosomal peptide synthetase [Daldinia childiae]|uniref:Polyketide synthase-nonribosomal peptide synthetase n=1 Tax=Daldinia childiae TaxID=326645 RepID=UPI001444EC68|nr:Polyketide synthase-nonribosomal peptide synthetase [Daldinia childiae]KAF3058598.1 Polyketide synthase-nonribosomal peptide synthetase [Daldinia childiae]